eukprot:6500754-Ditylum_brightwellii.AAC.1
MNQHPWSQDPNWLQVHSDWRNHIMQQVIANPLVCRVRGPQSLRTLQPATDAEEKSEREGGINQITFHQDHLQELLLNQM